MRGRERGGIYILEFALSKLLLSISGITKAIRKDERSINTSLSYSLSKFSGKFPNETQRAKQKKINI